MGMVWEIRHIKYYIHYSYYTHTCIHVVIDQKIFEGKRTRLSKYVWKEKQNEMEKNSCWSFRSFNGGLNTKRIRLLFCTWNMPKALKRLCATICMRYQANAFRYTHCRLRCTHTNTLHTHTRSVHIRIWHINSVWTFEMSNCVGGLSILCAVIRVRHRKIKYFWRKTHRHTQQVFSLLWTDLNWMGK